MKLKKRKKISKIERFKVDLTSMIFCTIIISLILKSFNYSFFEVLFKLIIGSLATPYRIVSTIDQAALFLIATIAITITLKINFISIGGEGQIMIGGIFASIIAFLFSELNTFFLVTLMILAAILSAGAYSALSAFFKIHFKTNETLVTLMLNFIAIQVALILQQGFLRDLSSLGYPKAFTFSNNATTSSFVSWIIAITLIILFCFLNKSRFNFQMNILKNDQQSARYAGINIAKITMIAVFISGALNGIVGFIQVSTHLQTMNPQLSANIGFVAIMIAWICEFKIHQIILTSFAFAILQQGSLYLESTLNISSAISLMIQGIILLTIISSKVFYQYQIDWKGSEHLAKHN